ncbi:hypothetical protein QBC38DRAFT_525009, partial [Podospora fimiseda]
MPRIRKRLVLKVLHDPTEVNPNAASPTVEEGDPFKTWSTSPLTPTEPGICWPKDLLPQKLTNIRVLSFGYNADIYLNQSKAGIRANAEFLLNQLKNQREDDPSRPIVFVAHRLGGLIVKQLLSFANFDGDRHGEIGSATKDILFFDTPNNAVDEKKWKLLAGAYRPYETKAEGPVAGLVVALTKEARDLAEVNEDFVHTSEKYPIFNFYATEPFPGTNSTIVNQQAARMFSIGEEGIPVDSDHVDMCRMEELDDGTFLDVVRCIKRVVPNCEFVGRAGQRLPADTIRIQLAMGSFTANQVEDEDATWVDELVQRGKAKTRRDASGGEIASPESGAVVHDCTEGQVNSLGDMLTHDVERIGNEKSKQK